MEKAKTLGTYDDTGNPKKEPILWIGKVIRKGDDLPSGENHADYIGAKGKYDMSSTCRTTKKFSLGQVRLSLGH